MDLLGIARGFTPAFLRETGIGHRAASEGVWGYGLHLFFQESQHHSGRQTDPCARVTGHPHTLLHRGDQRPSHLCPHGGPDWQPRCPSSALSGLGSESAPTLRPWPSAQCRAGVLTPRDTAGEDTHVPAHVRTQKFTHTTHPETHGCRHTHRHSTRTPQPSHPAWSPPTPDSPADPRRAGGSRPATPT